MKKFILLLFLVPMLSMVQARTTPFEKGLTLTQGKDKAEHENKYLLAVYFESPEQEANSRVFDNEDVANFLTRNFVSIRMYNAPKMEAYPTYVVFNPNGELVHRIVGEEQAYNFLNKIGKSIDPSTQYYTMVKEFEAGNRSPEFLKALTVAAGDAHETENTSRFLQAYLNSQAKLFTPENLKFLIKYTNNSNEKGFDLLLNDSEKVNGILGTGTAEEKLSAVIFQEEFLPKITDRRFDTEALVVGIKSKYQGAGLAQRIDLMQVEYLEIQENWKKLQTVLPAYLDKYSDQIEPETLNYYAWLVQEYMDSPELIQTALSWSKRSIAAKGNSQIPIYWSTYAKLLCKAGDVSEAVAWQQKSVEAENDTVMKKVYMAALVKMKKQL